MNRSDLNDLRRWLGLLERLPGVVHDVDLDARALVAERRVEPRQRPRWDVVARRGLQLVTTRPAKPEKPGLYLFITSRCSQRFPFCFFSGGGGGEDGRRRV